MTWWPKSWDRATWNLWGELWQFRCQAEWDSGIEWTSHHQRTLSHTMTWDGILLGRQPLNHWGHLGSNTPRKSFVITCLDSFVHQPPDCTLWSAPVDEPHCWYWYHEVMEYCWTHQRVNSEWNVVCCLQKKYPIYIVEQANLWWAKCGCRVQVKQFIGKTSKNFSFFGFSGCQQAHKCAVFPKSQDFETVWEPQLRGWLKDKFKALIR